MDKPVTDLPPPPCEAMIIKTAREAHGLSAEEASARVPIRLGPARWRQIEAGYERRQPFKAAIAPARTVAHMAKVVNVSPGQLEEAGRGDAASILRVMLRQDGELIARVSGVSFEAPEHHTGTSSIGAGGGVRVVQSDDAHVTFEVTVESGLTMDEAIQSLKPLAEHEELLINSLRIMKFGPLEVQGAVLVLRSEANEQAGPGVGPMRKKA